MTIISPSLLSCDFLHLNDELCAFKGAENLWFHLDIMDGHFVPNLTFGRPIIESISRGTNIPLDIHLMVENPAFHIETLRDMPLHNVTFHYESTVHHDRLIKLIKDHFPSVGLSLNPSTSIEAIPSYLLHEIDLILIMTVNPGFGGQNFIPGVLEKVERLNQIRIQQGLQFQIQVDGGVNALNAEKIIGCGVNNLVAGSYIFANGDRQEYLKRVNQLRK